MTDVIELSKTLMACPSVTPMDAGAMDVVQNFLQPLGFKIDRQRFGVVENLYARIGTASPHLCFAGHTDVVPSGDEALWKSPPFKPEVRDGKLYGRGASDMKTAITAFMCATQDYLKDNPKPKGSISFLITGDEEGASVDGTVKMVARMKEMGEIPDFCLVGEPSNPKQLGDMVKIGRRGTLSAAITVFGTQGHSAYPQLADNPVPKMIELLQRLEKHKLDDGTEHFDPSRLVLTSIDTGNQATNVIPAQITAKLNIRFNNKHSRKSLAEWVDTMCRESGARYEVQFREGAEPFLTSDHAFAERVCQIVESVTGRMPVKSTTGGTSDARFIKELCPVVEFGASNATAHKVDEYIEVEDLRQLQAIYRKIIGEVLS
jgi:succinyl-diaminopimelate desuccinylase